jgi:ribonuclease VapC
MPRLAIPMVVDTSAVLSLIQNEPTAPALRVAVSQDSRRLMSAMSVLEATCVLTGRRGPVALSDLQLFLHEFRFEAVAFDREQLALAQAAWVRFGRGNHPARLNFGDCASYALAKATGEPLLFVGRGFALTDVVAVKLEN